MVRTEHLLLTVIAVVSAVLVASIHLFYTAPVTTIGTDSESTHLFPYHVDEWQHLALSQYILEEGRLPFVNPYIDSQPSKQNFEVGFHVVTALFLAFVPFDPVRAYAFLPGLSMAASTIAMFYTLRSRFSARTSLFGAALLPFVPSSVNITGFWFFTPLSASIPAVLFLLGYYLRHGRDVWFYTGSLLLFPVYPPSFFFLLFTVAAHVFITGTYGDRLFVASGMSFVAVAVVLLQDVAMFTRSWQQTFAVEYFPFTLISPVISLLAVLGLLQVLEDSSVFLIWPVIAGVLLVLFALFDLSVLIPYPRALYYFLIGLVPLAAVGLETVVDGDVVTRYAVVGAMAVLLLIPYHSVDDERFKLQDFISEDDYDLLQRFDAVAEDNATVLAQPHFASTIYPVTESRVVALPDSLLAYGDARTYRRFVKGGCGVKRSIASSHGVDYVITERAFECDDFHGVTANSRFAYRVGS